MNLHRLILPLTTLFLLPACQAGESGGTAPIGACTTDADCDAPLACNGGVCSSTAICIDPTDCGGIPAIGCPASWGGYDGTGSLTHYWFAQGTSGIGDVHCSYGIQSNPDRAYGAQGEGQYFAAMNTADYASAAACGACVEVSRDNGKSVVVTVVDECPISSNPKCVPGHIDLSTAAFQQLGDPELEGYLGERAGRGKISWKYVPCPSTGPIALQLKEASNQFWNEFLIRNHPYPIKSAEVEINSNWVQALRQPYNYWLPPDGAMGNYKVRITDINGSTVTHQFLLDGAIQPASSNFSCQ